MTKAVKIGYDTNGNLLDYESFSDFLIYNSLYRDEMLVDLVKKEGE